MTLLPVEVKKLNFEENDECQYLLSKLLDIHKSFLNNAMKDIQKRRWKRNRQRNMVIKW